MTEIKKENEQMHKESSLPEITKENEQMHESFSEDFLWVSPWISTRQLIKCHPMTDEDKVIHRIVERLSRYEQKNIRFYQRKLDVNIVSRESQIHVNNTMSLDDRKPIVVSIGPNHRDTTEPDLMEVHKLKYLQDFVQRTNTTMEELVDATMNTFIGLKNFTSSFGIRGEVEFGKCFYDLRAVGPNYEFIEMCILDGCFILELFLKNITGQPIADDPIFNSEWVLWALSRDLILPDNQLPFWVLGQLWTHTNSDQLDLDDIKLAFTEMASKFLERIVPNQKLNRTSFDYGHAKMDLRGFVYDCLNWPRMSSENSCNFNIDGDDKWNMAKSATELEEFGVEFKMMETDNFIDIKFTNKGVLEISCIRIRYGTPYSIKVLLEYEQSHRQQHKYLNNYLRFMNNLVKSPNDVQLLRQKGIIDNLSELPDDAAIHKFLKDLYASLRISPTDFRYIQVCRDLNLHCKHRRNIWMAKLKRDYFNSPWAFISFFAASLLLILTIAQTAFSVVSYYKRG